MLDSGTKKTVEWVDNTGRLFTRTPLHALDDPAVWLRSPAYDPPADVDINAVQKWIDSMMGTTHDGESIYKLIWNGDRRYWYRFYMQWDALGRPTAPPVERPLIRYKVLRDTNGRAVKDIFPPRWLIMTRLEPHQYADNYKAESYIYAPEIRCNKQIRPDEPPKVFWLWWGTVASHGDYCCATADKNKRMCFGKYISPYQFGEQLGQQRLADLSAGTRSVYQNIDRSFAGEIEDENTGYKLEMAELEAEAQIFIENPMALLGLEQTARVGIDDHKTARQIVKDIYDKQIQEHSKLI